MNKSISIPEWGRVIELAKVTHDPVQRELLVLISKLVQREHLLPKFPEPELRTRTGAPPPRSAS